MEQMWRTKLELYWIGMAPKPDLYARIKVPRENVVIYVTTCSPHMRTSSNVNIFRATGPLCGEFPGQRWIPLTKASDAAELWCFLLSAPEQTVE